MIGNPPESFTIIKKGELTRKDLIWDRYTRTWVNPKTADLATFGYDISNYTAVARKTT